MLLGTVAVGVLYDTAFEVERRRLQESAESRVRLIEAVAKLDKASNGNYPDGETAATVSRIIEAHNGDRGFGETGEIVIAHRIGEQMVFMLRRRHDTVRISQTLPFDTPLARPMRQALLGHSGSIVARDYRGVDVLAVYRPVKILNFGLVTKIDLAEIRAPFVRAGLIVVGLGLIILVFGATISISNSKAVSRRIQESEMRYRALSGLTGEGVAIHEAGIIVEANQAFADMFGYDRAELGGKPVSDLTSGKIVQQVMDRIARNENDEYESSGLHKDGHSFSVDIKSMPTVYLGRQMRVSRVRDRTEQQQAAAAIRDSEERYRNITDNLPVLISYVDRDKRYQSANKLHETWYGKPVSEIIGRRMDEVMLPESYEMSKDFIARALAGEVVRYEGDSTTPDGVRRYRRVNYLPHRAQNGEVLGFYSLVEDFTDIKLAALELQRQGESLATAQRIGNMGNWEREFETGALNWSDQAYRIFGVSRELPEAITRPAFLDLIHDDDRAFVSDALNAAIESDAPYSIDHRIVRPDGEVRVVHEEAEVYRDAAGRPLRMAGTVHDITEQKQIEQALRDSGQQLRLITDALPVVISYIDANERYGFVNKLAAEWFAQPISGIVGAQVVEVLGPEAYETVRPSIAAALSGKTQHFEATLTYPDGGTREMEVTDVPHLGPHGAVLGFYSLAVDVTDRHALESRLRQSQKMEAIGQLTGGISHEFNNLLQVVIGNLELLVQSVPASDRVEEFAEAIRRNVDRGADLTSHLLSFSRKAPLAPKVLEVGAVLVETQSMWLRTLGESIELNVIPPKSPWSIRVDAGQLASALLNLALNARDAMPDGGTITMAGETMRLDAAAAEHHEAVPGDYIVLSVSDTGEGMPEEILSHAFNPFFTTKEVGKGTGLGLSMVHGFAHQSGGFAEIESEAGQGTTVRMYLPRLEVPLDAAGAVEPADHPSISGEGVILLVEDDADVREALAALLADQNFQIIEAEDASKALAAVADGQKIDLLFTDVVMPGGMNGLYLAQALRTSQPDVKVIYTTGYTDEILAEAGRLEENAIVLRKPYNRAELIAAVAQVLPGKTPASHCGLASR
ncbi:MAG: PAS domain S-box protein [Rhodospirillaceae bacterium]|nr:PAS domain S-box protein [Rhodospirillaceae bacterium]